jgi:hypothetical protein
MSTIPKRILVADRVRRPPATGWSWVDRRFLREHGDHLSREALLLYLFLAAVADRHGLSFYSDHTLTSRLRLAPQVLEKARQELLDRDLIAYQLPLVQVLALPAITEANKSRTEQTMPSTVYESHQSKSDSANKAATNANQERSSEAPKGRRWFKLFRRD